MNRSRGPRKDTLIEWLFIWGEIEQQRIHWGDLAPVLIGDSSRGARRGGYSLPDSLLAHAQVDGHLNKLGPYAKSLVAELYVYGWEWAEIFEERKLDSGDTNTVPTGRYERRMTHHLPRHKVRTIQDITAVLAAAMGY